MTGVFPGTWRAFGAYNRLYGARVVARGFGAALAFNLMLTGSVVSPTISTAYAQQLPITDPNAQLLLKADELIYNNDAEEVTARGNVQLSYNGYDVVADRVSYNQATQRVKAFGNVEILEPSGNRIYAQEIDLTGDFRDGFINALRVETAENTRFAAESGKRNANGDTVFHNGVYTACEPCKEKPNRAPIWQVKAQKVIIDGVTKDYTYKNATFELFGLPIAYFPIFSHADPAIKRKSGFLIPSIGASEDLGYYIRQPYFLVTGDTHDLTFAATPLSEQGVMGDLQWRHQLDNGSYSVQLAGIDQQAPENFTSSPDKDNDTRGMVATEGRFSINPRWAFGWNILAQTDSNFSRTYKVPNYTGLNVTNSVYLEGLHNRSFFNLSAKQYLVQNSTLAGNGTALQFESDQAFIHPIWDYNYVTSENLTGGELSFDFNVASLSRSNLSSVNTGTDIRTYGIDGDTTRVSADLGWMKTATTNGGLAITPSLSLRGDWTSTRGLDATETGDSVETGNYARFMPTAGLEVRYPLLLRSQYSSHVFEPIAQVFARPDLNFKGVAANEDAQSLVFDTTNLFQRDKFSGFDRIEGGTRANLGLQYSGQFFNDFTINGVFGQSYHLAGKNPYARKDDLTNVGEDSGLETSRSDYVASLGFSNLTGFGLQTQARFDEDDFEIKRAEAILSYTNGPIKLATNYTHISAQPNYAFPDDREQVGLSGSWNFAENWRAFGGLQYDTKSELLLSDTVGLSYSDECFIFSLSFNESRSKATTTEVQRSVNLAISFKTIGDFGSSFGEDGITGVSGLGGASDFLQQP